MPSASSKSEKTASTEATDPLKQAIVIIEHKIRNLEKRKSKLDSYKESIKSLTKEQVEAISKYDEVVQQLELSKEYVKQFTVISIESDKLKKKQAKKDAQEKFISEVNKVKQVLQIQDVLQNMGTESVREDFLSGKNGAVQLTEDDLKVLDDLYVEVSPKRVSENSTIPPNDLFQKAAEYFMAIIEGKAKEIVGSTGAKIRDLVNSIHSCGYFDQLLTLETNPPSLASNVENETPEEVEFHENQEILSNVIVPPQNPPEGNMQPISSSATPVQSVMPGGSMLPPVSQPNLMQTSQQPIVAPNVTSIVPTPVSQVESSFFNAQGFKPPAPPSVVPPPSQNSRQINEVIQSVAGKFNFLQESEIDMTEMNAGVVPGNASVPAPPMAGAPPSTIPTQTFTNQNFNGQPGGAPAYPPNYPPQPAAFQPFVPPFPPFVPSNTAPVQNANTNTSSANPATVAPINSSVNPNIPTTSNNINNSSNKCNNIPNPIPNSMAPNRNSNVNFNQSQQQIPSGYPNSQNSQNMSQIPNQPAFQRNNINVSSAENPKIEEAVPGDNEIKEKLENEKRDWNQPETKNWADDWNETTEWNSPNQNQPDGTSNSNKFSSGRPNRSGNGITRNTNSYQGSRNRTNRQGGFRDSQNNQGGGGISGNYYQNHNDYQRNERNDYSVGGKGNSDLRDGNFKERGDFSNRERDNYGGSFKRGPMNRGPNMKSLMDRGDRQVQIQRNNPGGPRGPRNINRQPSGRSSGSSFQRQQPNSVGQPATK